MPQEPVTHAAIAETPHLEAAADWFVTLSQEDSAENRRRWQRWLDAAPAHRAAWQKVEQLQTLLAGAPAQTRLALHKPGGKTRRQMLAFFGIAAGVGYALFPWRAAPAPVQWIATGKGERRAVSLPDGGQVWLGSATRLGIAYTDDSRDLYLSQGSLQLRSGRDPQRRPLRIVARDGVVRPLGTRFTLSTYEQRTELAVQEHAVEVQPLAGAPVRVAQGQRLVFTKAGSGRPQTSNVADDAWTTGLVMAMNTPLAEFAERFALHSGQPVEVAPALANRTVSGIYKIDAAQDSLETLAEVLAVRLERTGQGWRLRPR